MSIFSVFSSDDRTPTRRAGEEINIAKELRALQSRIVTHEICPAEAKVQLESIFPDVMQEQDVREKIAFIDKIKPAAFTGLLEEPSVWASRELLGLRHKEFSKKTDGPRRIIDQSEISSLLERRWQTIFRSRGQSTLDDLVDQAKAFQEQGMHEDAFNCYFEAAAWCRELRGEIENNAFLQIVEDLISCSFKIGASPRSAVIDDKVLRCVVKILNISSPNYGAPRDCRQAQIAAKTIFKKLLADRSLRNLLVRVCGRATASKSRNEQADGYMLQIWQQFLAESSLWSGLSEEEYAARKTVHIELAKIRHRHTATLEMLSLPVFVPVTNLSEDLFMDSRNSRYQPGAIHEIDQFCDFIVARKSHQTRESSFRKTSCTLLMYGPSGTGKTDVALGVAKKLGIEIMKVGGSEVKNMWYGVSEKNLKEKFEQAKARAILKKTSNIVILLDELDGLCTARKDSTENGSNSNGADRGLLTTLLDLIEPDSLKYSFEKDGVQQFGEVVVVAATNVIDDVDDAVISRFMARVNMPRWSPRENFALLRRISEFPSYAPTADVLFSLFSSRMQLRDVHKIAYNLFKRKEDAVAESPRKQLYNITSQFRTVRANTAHGNGDLVPNSRYTCALSCLTNSELNITTVHKVQAFQVSLAPLAKLDESLLSLKKHPYVSFFQLDDKECFLVANDDGIAFGVANVSGSNGETLKIGTYGCLPGHSSCSNRQNMENKVFNDDSYRVHYSLDTHQELVYEVYSDSRRFDNLAEVDAIVAEGRESIKFIDFPFFWWNQIVPGPNSFYDARPKLMSYSDGKAEINIELFVEL